MLSKPTYAAIIMPAAATEYGVMSDGCTFEIEDVGTYVFDFSGGKTSKFAQSESASSEKNRKTAATAYISRYIGTAVAKDAHDRLYRVQIIIK